MVLMLLREADPIRTGGFSIKTFAKVF